MAATASTPACSGVFFRLHCRHQKLFDTEYKRSNRNRGTKILRCFPHCCPGHVERSYCGSSLELAVEMHEPLHVDVQTLFVFARFETVDLEDAPAMGQRYSLERLLTMSKNEANPDAPWTQGVLQPSSSKGSASTVFVLNGHTSSKWYYHWESGANKARRLTKHVLKAYVMYRRPQSGVRDDLVQVICTVSSPPFTLVSYRRAWEGLEGVVDGADRGSPLETDGRTHAYDLHRIVRGQISQAFQSYQNSPDHEPKPKRLRQDDSSDDGDAIPHEPHQWIWERHHAAALRPVKDLAVIYYFVSRTPMALAMQSSRVREHMCAALQEHWTQDAATKGLLQPGALVTLLFPRPEVTISASATLMHAQVEKLLVIVAKLAIWMLSGENVRLFQAGFHACAGHLLHKDRLRGAYLRFVGLLCQRIELFWSEQITASSAAGGSQSSSSPSNALRMLSEHILALSHVHVDFQSMWPDLREALETPTSLLWESFVAQVRETFVRKQQQARRRSMVRVVSSGLNGCWCLASVDAEEKLEDASISATLLGMAQLQQVYLRVASRHTLQIRGKSSLLAHENAWLDLVCDDTPRTASILPLGLSTLVGFQARGIDYVGTMNDKRSRVQLELYWWPCPAQDARRRQRATRVVLTLKLETLSTSVHVTMEMHHSSLSAEELRDLVRVELGTAKERLNLIVEWTHAWRGTAQFIYADN